MVGQLLAYQNLLYPLVLDLTNLISPYMDLSGFFFISSGNSEKAQWNFERAV